MPNLHIFFLLLLNLLVCNCSKILYKEEFLLGPNDWLIIGNNNTGNNGIKIIQESIFAPYLITRGNKVIANRYIVGDDKLINVNPLNNQLNDANLWYFKKVFEKPLNLKDATVLQFTLIPFVGNFTTSNLNKKNNSLVKLVSSKGLLIETNHNLFTNIDISNGYKFNIPLIDKVIANETNIQDILANLKEIQILGDWTRGYEVVGLDDIIFYE